jgi:hypothetical protein
MVDYFMQAYLNAIEKFLKLSEGELDMGELNKSINEVKLLLNCLGDILIIENGNDKFRSNLVHVQTNDLLLDKTFEFFKIIQLNNNLVNYFKLKDGSEGEKTKEAVEKSFYFNLKCDLTRLIGILVFENKENQRLLVRYDVLNLITENLKIDLDNPFIMEWSVVALKHILICND